MRGGLLIVLVLAVAAMASAALAPEPAAAHECSAGGDRPPTGRAIPPPPYDQDCDYVNDDVDNCPPQFPDDFANRNPDQTDTDGDGAGDKCDGDDDNDGVADGQDNCRTDANPDQRDSDGDGIGDACVKDRDGDGVIDPRDNCPRAHNPDQRDNESDGLGDVCDPDDDDDYFLDSGDNCPLAPNQDQADADGDGVGTVCDPSEGPLGGPPAPPGAVTAGRDTRAPSVRVVVARSHRVEQLGGGLVVGVRCSEACTVVAELRVSARQARRLRLSRSRPVARGTAELGGAGSTYAFLRFDRRAWQRLQRARRVTTVLRVTAVDRAGNSRRAARTLSLRR